MKSIQTSANERLLNFTLFCQKNENYDIFDTDEKD